MHDSNIIIMNTKELTPLQKLMASSKSRISASFRSSNSADKLYAAKSVGEIEGYLQCMKHNGLITPEEYAEAYENMANLWSRI